MTRPNLSPFANVKYDLPAALVVFLVALPLCLGVALASGAPLFSGLTAGVVGGIVIGFLSKSPLSVSGPAAGLTTIVFTAMHTLPSFEAFLLAVFLAGILQIGLGAARAGVIGDFIPSAVIKGMLAAIGLILILKQLPHAVGWDASFEGDEAFGEMGGENTFSRIWHLLDHLTPGAVLISSLGLLILFGWDWLRPRLPGWLRQIPGPLVVVLMGVFSNLFFLHFLPELAVEPQHMVAVPAADSLGAFLGQFRFPDFGMIQNHAVWSTAVTIALVASVETLLSIEAIDKLDPFKRITPTNRELVAQGAGNMVSGLLGGLPVTSVIVRSSANAISGGRTRTATIVHGLLLLLSVLAIPHLLNQIPLAALAAILIGVGYKLTKPSLYIQKYQKGMSYFVPFVVTIAAILLTDLLKGIGIGVAVGVVFLLIENVRKVAIVVADGRNLLVRFKRDLYFIHKYDLKQTLNRVPPQCSLLLDLSRVGYMDRDNVEILNDFLQGAPYKDIRVEIKTGLDTSFAPLLHIPDNSTVTPV